VQIGITWPQDQICQWGVSTRYRKKIRAAGLAFDIWANQEQWPNFTSFAPYHSQIHRNLFATIDDGEAEKHYF
jgi:hypothetical protein